MKKKKILYFILGIVVIFMIGLFCYHQVTFLNRLVTEKRNEWDLPLIQSTLMSGQYMGKLYENEYTVDDFSGEMLSTLLTDYYIYNDDTFFQEENRNNNYLYTKIISSDTVKNTLKKMFGPDYEIPHLVNINYGCGRSFIQQGENYLISSYEDEYCGLFLEDTDTYLVRMTDYKKEKDKIYITMKVGYLEAVKDETTGEIISKIYDTKLKNQVIDANYPIECYSTDSESCYQSWNDYVITLAKASDRKYYFYAIEKGTY